jgi:hypothetical protein
MLNPFNHANDVVPNLTLLTGSQNGSFGDEAVTATGNRQIRFKLKYSF